MDKENILIKTLTNKYLYLAFVVWVIIGIVNGIVKSNLPIKDFLINLPVMFLILLIIFIVFFFIKKVIINLIKKRK